MQRANRPTLEHLEDRSVPATFMGGVWPDPQHLTLSFVPDGTQTGSGPSNLFATLGAQNAAAWEQTMLRAVQTWAFNSNINITVVPDSGDPLGTPGAAQGDPRFGDIRIAAVPLASSTVATGNSYTPGSTWSGDIVLNSSYSFGSGAGQFDLATVVMHEAGHVFGQADNNDPTSIMDQRYLGPRTAPSAADIQGLQTLYGARSPEAKANNTLATAVQLQPAPGTGSSGPMTVTADIASNQDVDWYSFKLDGSAHPDGINIRLQASTLSLMTGQMSIYDSAGHFITSVTASDPLHNDLLIHLNTAQPNATYYVEVQGGTQDVFGIGAYQLTVDQHPENDGVVPHVTDNAVDLHQLEGAGSPALTASGSITQSQPTNVYRFQIDKGDFSGGVTLSLQYWGLGISAPQLSVYDNNGNLLGSVSTSNALGGTLSFHLSSVTANAAYFVRIDSGTAHYFSMGAFNLGVVAGPAASSPSDLLTALSNPQPNSSLQQATQLSSILPGSAAQTDSQTIANLGVAGEVDYYRVHTVHASGTQTTVLTVSVLSEDTSGLAPVVTVYDQQGNIVPATVLGNDLGQFTVEVAAAPDKDYYLAVSAGPLGTSQVGNYFLTATSSVGTVAPVQPSFTDDLTPTAPIEMRTLNLAQNGLVQFALSVSGSSSASGTGVEMIVKDQYGATIDTLVAFAGTTASTGAFYLNSGVYTVQFVALSSNPAALGSLTYGVSGGLVSQPVGPMLLDPATSASGSTTPSTSSGYSPTNPTNQYFLSNPVLWWGPSYKATDPVVPTARIIVA
jgi:hypothetical protein